MGAEVLKSPSFAMSVYAVRRLKIAQRQHFDTPVTAFLTDSRTLLPTYLMVRCSLSLPARHLLTRKSRPELSEQVFARLRSI